MISRLCTLRTAACSCLAKRGKRFILRGLYRRNIQFVICTLLCAYLVTVRPQSHDLSVGCCLTLEAHLFDSQCTAPSVNIRSKNANETSKLEFSTIRTLCVSTYFPTHAFFRVKRTNRSRFIQFVIRIDKPHSLQKWLRITQRFVPYSGAMIITRL